MAATIMPDHLHLLFKLGDRLSFGQVVGKLKTLARDRGRAKWKFQEDGYEHQLRPVDSMEDYGFYIFMNPYRARLLAMDQTWPCWVCPDSRQFRFVQYLGAGGLPAPEWLSEVEIVAKRIFSGEE